MSKKVKGQKVDLNTFINAVESTVAKPPPPGNMMERSVGNSGSIQSSETSKYFNKENSVSTGAVYKPPSKFNESSAATFGAPISDNNFGDNSKRQGWSNLEHNNNKPREPRYQQDSQNYQVDRRGREDDQNTADLSVKQAQGAPVETSGSKWDNIFKKNATSQQPSGRSNMNGSSFDRRNDSDMNGASFDRRNNSDGYRQTNNDPIRGNSRWSNNEETGETADAGNRRTGGWGANRNAGDAEGAYNSNDQGAGRRFQGNNRNDNFGGDRYGGERSGGRYGDRDRYNGDRSEFGNRGYRGGDRYGNGGGYRREPRDFSGPLPTAPKAVLADANNTVATPAVLQVNFAAPPPVPSHKKEAVIDSKATRSAAKQEANRLAKEQKEAMVAKDAEKRELEMERKSQSSALAKDLLATGIKGPALTEHVKGSGVAVSGSVLLREVLNQSEDVLTSKWWTKDEFGDVLSFLLTANSDPINLQQQIEALFEVQGYCHEKKFPVIEVKGEKKRLISLLNSTLLNNQLIDPEALIGWADYAGENDGEGRANALFQTSDLVSKMKIAMAENFDDEDEEEDDIDRPRDVV